MAKKTEIEKNLDPIYYLALDGNVKAAMLKLKTISLENLNPIEIATRKKYLDRFGNQEPPIHPMGNSLVEDLSSIYRSYWDQVLLQKLNQKEGQQFLFDRLRPLAKNLEITLGNFSDKEYEQLAVILTEKLKAQGIHSLIGTVKPHMNFMAWKKESIKKYTVNLGTGEQTEVDVVLMDDFLSLGWAAYATFDKLHVAGWVGNHALHCVESAYDLKSENFRVSFLAHEARHFVDLKKYPNLKSVDLEYRAKLNELILASLSMEELLKKFILERKANPENPHSYASWYLLKRISEQLKEPLELDSLLLISKKHIRNLSKRLLIEHSRKLGDYDAKQVETVMAD